MLLLLLLARGDADATGDGASVSSFNISNYCCRLILRNAPVGRSVGSWLLSAAATAAAATATPVDQFYLLLEDATWTPPPPPAAAGAKPCYVGEFIKWQCRRCMGDCPVNASCAGNRLVHYRQQYVCLSVCLSDCIWVLIFLYFCLSLCFCLSDCVWLYSRVCVCLCLPICVCVSCLIIRLPVCLGRSVLL